MFNKRLKIENAGLKETIIGYEKSLAFYKDSFVKLADILEDYKKYLLYMPALVEQLEQDIISIDALKRENEKLKQEVILLRVRNN